MVSKYSALAELSRMRARGQKPDYPIVIGDCAAAHEWAERNRFFYVPRKQIASDLSAFVGLHVYFRTCQPFDQEFAQQIALEAASVTLVDAYCRKPFEMVAA